jgi:type IV pilus assembly protein PilW
MKTHCHKTIIRSNYQYYYYKAAGFSLVELMVSIAIGLIVILALTGVLMSSSTNSKTNDRSSELQGNGRFALDHLKREIRHAGYRGNSWAEPNVPTTTITPITNECLATGATAGTFVSNIRQGIWGSNNSNPFSANCLAAGYLRGDVLVVRRLGFSPLNGNSITNTLYFRSSYSAGEVFRGNGAAATTGSPAINGSPLADFVLQEFIYFIGSDDYNTSVPALRRITLKGNGEDCNGTTLSAVTMCNEMVVSGIEHMHVQYGRLDTALKTGYFSGSNISGSSSESPTTLTSYAWDDVNSARVWLIARSANIEKGYSNTNSYVMGDLTYGPVSDGFRRQLFNTVVQLRN